MLAFGSVSCFYVIRRLWRRFLMREANQEQSMACHLCLKAPVLDAQSGSRIEHGVLFMIEGAGS